MLCSRVVAKEKKVVNGHGARANQSLVCPESCRLLAGESPVVVTARRPRGRLQCFPRPRLAGHEGRWGSGCVESVIDTFVGITEHRHIVRQLY